MKIAIPTHRRSEVINGLTLAVLQDMPKDDITIFVSDAQDMPLYERTCPGYRLVLCNTKTATEKFNTIQNHYDGKDWVFVLEDDIRKVQSIMTQSLPKLFGFIEQFCNAKGIKAFGVYPSSNKFFMSKSIDIGQTYIVANLFGFKARPDAGLLCQLKTKTDYERSIKYYKTLGPLARFNFVSCLTNNYTNKGGMQEIADRATLEREASLMLCHMYPDVFSINDKRKSKYTEVKMVKRVEKVQL
jgi:hypothetical protein